MKQVIVVDANVILSALLGGKARIILFNPQFKFLTTKFNLQEVQEYLPMVEKKTGISENELNGLIALLPLTAVSQDIYHQKIRQAKLLIGNIDPHDVDLLALALVKNSHVWSEDKHFDSVAKKIKVLKTKDFLSN